MTIPKDIFVQEEVYSGSNVALAEAMMDAMHETGFQDTELSLAFLEIQAKPVQLQRSTSESTEDTHRTTNTTSSSSKATKTKTKTKRSQLKGGAKLARKMFGL
jgi:hypothetical protein